MVSKFLVSDWCVFVGLTCWIGLSDGFSSAGFIATRNTIVPVASIVPAYASQQHRQYRGNRHY